MLEFVQNDKSDGREQEERRGRGLSLEEKHRRREKRRRERETPAAAAAIDARCFALHAKFAFFQMILQKGRLASEPVTLQAK